MTRKINRINSKKFLLPAFLGIIALYKSQLVVGNLIIALFLGACVYITENYYGKRTGLSYSFWKKSQSRGYPPEKNLSGLFAKREILLNINLTVMLIPPILNLLYDEPRFARISTILGMSLITFLVLDCLSEINHRNN